MWQTVIHINTFLGGTMAKHIYGTIVSDAPRGTTASGNPIVDVTIRPADGGDDVTARVSHDASLSYGIHNHRKAGEPRAYVFTDAGRVSHEDVYATSAYRRLYRVFPRGAEVTTLVTHVSATGMSRWLRVLGVDVDHSGEGSVPKVEDYTLSVARVFGWRSTERGELVVSGANVDLGFHTAYTLASRLYGDGYALNHRGL